MELDSRKKRRRDRMMRSKSFETQEVREIGRKKARQSRGFPMEDLAAISAREIKRAAAEETEKDEYSSAEGQ